VPAHSVIWLFLIDALHAAIDPIYNDALKREIDKIAAAIPNEELAIQFDVASAVFARVERNEASTYGRNKAEMQDRFADILIALGNHVPDDIDLLYHLCCGDSGHKHVVEPTDMADMVEFANRVSQPCRRRLFRAPQTARTSSGDSELCLGLVHYTDGVTGTKQRLETAKRHVPDAVSDFAIATECGFGRRDTRTIPELLRIHAAVADET
jgi:hypothetical protein